MYGEDEEMQSVHHLDASPCMVGSLGPRVDLVLDSDREIEALHFKVRYDWVKKTATLVV